MTQNRLDEAGFSGQNVPMRFTPAIRLALLLFTACALHVFPVAGQSILFTENEGKFLPVLRAHGTQPYVKVDGKLVPAFGHRYALQKTEEYMPAFISVRNMEAKSTYLDATGSELNHDFHFRATLETPYWLDDVFLVLEMDTERAGKVIFLFEVGQLEAREPRNLALTVPMTVAIGKGRFQFHLFSGGVEVLHSEIDPMRREQVVDRMTAKRIAGVQEAAPKPFFGPGPEYPPALRKSKTKGQAVITMKVLPNGRIYEPVIKSASDPAFGESALAATRMWRFFPRIKDGHPIECFVDLPFDFVPPEKPAKKS